MLHFVRPGVQPVQISHSTLINSDLLPNCCNQSYQSDIKWAYPEWLPERIGGLSECFSVKHLRNTSDIFAICYSISFFSETTDNENHLS